METKQLTKSLLWIKSAFGVIKPSLAFVLLGNIGVLVYSSLDMTPKSLSPDDPDIIFYAVAKMITLSLFYLMPALLFLSLYCTIRSGRENSVGRLSIAISSVLSILFAIIAMEIMRRVGHDIHMVLK